MQNEKDTDERAMKKYENIINHIVEKIVLHEYAAEQRLPSENELMNAFDVSSITVKRAMKELTLMGHIYRVKGRGSFVSNSSPALNTPRDKKLIVLVLSDDQLNNSSLVGILRGIQHVLAESGHILVVEYADGSYEQEEKVLKSVAGKQIDGLLIYINHVHLVHEILHKEHRQSIPYVMIDRWNPIYPCNLVAPNNYDSVYLAAEHLIELGHRSITFIAFHNMLESERERYRGFCNALRNHNILFDSNTAIHTIDDLDAEFVDVLHHSGVTAVVCANDRVALQLISAAETAELSVPDHISIIGFDDYAPVQYLSVPLTTIHQDFERLGGAGAEVILDCIQSEHTHQHSYKKIFLPTVMIERSTVKDLRSAVPRTLRSASDSMIRYQSVSTL